MGRVGLQGPWAGLLRDTCTSQVRVGVPEAGRLPEQSGMPQVAGRHPQPWWTPEWQALASQLQSRVLGNGGLIVAHKGDFAKVWPLMCIVLSFQGGPLKTQALLREAVCLDWPAVQEEPPRCGLAGRGREAGGELAWGHGVPCPSWVWPPTPPVRSAWWGPVFLGLGVGALVPEAPQACLCPDPSPWLARTFPFPWSRPLPAH